MTNLFIHGGYPMRTIVIGFLLTVTQVLNHSAAIPVQAQSAGNRGHIRIYVIDREGQPIPNAEAILTGGEAISVGMGRASSDASGLICFQLDAMPRLPAFIEVTARGYQPQNCSLDNARMSEITVVLRALDSGTPRAGTTVSAAELPEARQKEADRYNRQGIEALRGGDYSGAERLFRQAVSLAPSIPAFYNNIGVTLVRKGEVDRSADWFEKARQLRPYDPFALGNLGLLRWAQKRHAESMQLLDRAVASGFQNPNAHYILGILALENGDWRRADKELSIVPGDRFPYKHLYRSVALIRLGRPGAAAKSLAQFRKRTHAPYSLASMR